MPATVSGTAIIIIVMILMRVDAHQIKVRTDMLGQCHRKLLQPIQLKPYRFLARV